MKQPPSIRLVVRADDAGSFISANEAIEQSVEAGLVRNVSVMVPGPAFDDAVRRFAGRNDLCLGLHITLNAELNHPKWGPVLPLETVRSLVDGNGYFRATPLMTQEIGFLLDEAVREIEAQLAAAREAGLKISYVDEHMAVSRIGLRPYIAELCRREGLIDVHGLARLPLGTSLDSARNQLVAASPGNYVWVTHPNQTTAETLRLRSPGHPKEGNLALIRNAERQLLTEPHLHDLFDTHGVQPVCYSEI